MMSRLRSMAAGLALVLASPALLAHDFWIEPSTFTPAPGQVVALSLRVGQNMVGDPVALNPDGVNEFAVYGPGGSKPVVGRRGADPAGLIRAAAPALLVVGFYGQPNRIELGPEIFNPYLVEEGLDAVIAVRASRKQTGASARELYSRCAKSLLLSGAASASQGDRVLGFPLELTAERNPYMLRANEDLPLRLTYLGRPLAGALVAAMNTVNPALKQSVRTDADGRVRLQMHHGGMWLVKAVHMVAAPASADADWLSYWASLTFEVRLASSNVQGS